MSIQTTGAGPAKGVFVNNRWSPAASARTLPVTAPAEGAVFTAIAAGGAEDVDRAVKAGRATRSRCEAAEREPSSAIAMK